MKVSVDKWMEEAKASENADKVGMWLLHNGVVRSTAKAAVRGQSLQGLCEAAGAYNASSCEHRMPPNTVKGMEFSYDKELLKEIVAKGWTMPGVYYLRAELAEGSLNAGEDIMYLLVGADIRDHAVFALNTILAEIKGRCVKEVEVV